MRELNSIEYKKAVHDFEFFCRRCCWIVDKKHSRTKFIPNDLQLKLINGFTKKDGTYVKGLRDDKRVRWIILKYRQKGISTMFCMFGAWRALTRPNFGGEHYLHLHPPTRQFARKYQFAHDNLPVNFKNEKTDNPTMKEFQIPDLNSYVKFSTAGTRTGASRSETKSFLHFSEPALYESLEEVYTAAKDTVPDEDFTYFVLESTPMGIADDFASMYFNAKRGENQFQALFFPWHEDPLLAIHNGEVYEPQSEEEITAQEKYGLTDAQMKWRRNEIKRYVVRDAARGLATFKREFPESDTDCFMSSAFAFFPTQVIQDHIARVEIQTREGTIKPKKGSEFFPDAKRRVLLKDVVIFKPAERGKKYGLGGDTSEAVEKGDFQALVGIELESGEQVAQFHGKVPLERLAEIANELGRYYNDAVLAIEINNHGHVVVEKLYNEYKYPNLYRSKSRSKNIVGDVSYVSRYGFNTMHGGNVANSKKYIMDTLSISLATPEVFPNDIELLTELLHYEERLMGRLGAPEGKYDDLVIALAIAWNCRGQMASSIELLPFTLRRRR